MLDSRIEHINATLAELTELMQLVSESYPEVPAILCKISLEKGESLCEELRALNTVKETIPMVEQTAEKVESGEASLLVYENAERNDIPMCDTVSKENKEYGESFSHSEEKDIPDVETSSLVFSWDATDEEFCLFDRIPEMQDSERTDDILPQSYCEVSRESSGSEESREKKDIPLLDKIVAGNQEDAVSPEEKEGDSLSEYHSEKMIAVSGEENSLEEKPESDVPEEGMETIVHSEESKADYRELQKMMSINDRFLFRRELFDNDGDLMAQTIEELNHITSYEESLTYLQNRFAWDFESEAFELLRSLLQQRFE